MKETDAELIARVRAGEREVFGALVERYRDMVYGLGYHLTGDFEAARDLAQEAFVQAYLKLGQLRAPERFPAWLRRITANLHRNQLRRQVATVPLSEEQAAAAQEQWPAETEVAVREALARLRPPERLALTLHYVNGYSQAEIGAFLGVRPETVKTRLARARARLREEIIAMVDETFEWRKLPEEFTAQVMQRLLRQLAAAEDPFTSEGLGRVASESEDPEVAEVAQGLRRLLDQGGDLYRAMLFAGTVSLGADGFVRLAETTGRREGLVVAAQLLESGLVQPDSPVSADEVASFCAYLSCIFQVGVPILQAFEWAGRRFPALAELTTDMTGEARAGRHIADAFARRGAVFTEPFVGAIRLAESTGTLDGVLATLAALLWEPSLLDTGRIGGKWSEKLARAEEILRQSLEVEREFERRRG